MLTSNLKNDYFEPCFPTRSSDGMFARNAPTEPGGDCLCLFPSVYSQLPLAWRIHQFIESCLLLVESFNVRHGGLMCHLPLTPGQNGQNEFFSPKFDEKCLKKSFLKKMAEMKILVFYLILVKNHIFPKIQCNTCNF